MPTHPVYRAARSMVFASFCVGLAIAGHVMASGATVSLVAAGCGLTAMLVVAIVLTGTERSLATIFGGLAGGQFALHALFAAAQHGQHLEHGVGMAPSERGWAMTLVHLAAAVVSAWWLRRGERAVWSLARRVASALTRPVRALSPPPVPATARSMRAGFAATARPRPAFLRHVVVRRGPPSAWASLA